MSKDPMTELAEQGNELEARFRQYAEQPREPEFQAVVDELRDWLMRCVAHGRFLPGGSPERRRLQGQVDYWTSRLRQAGQTVDDVDRIEPFDPKAGHPLADDLFPYLGLSAATGTAGKVFAGRDEQIQEYADHLDGHAALLIQSESGGGKSSVAMAGVLPELARRHPDWLVLPRVTPGTQPADALRDALMSLLALGVVDARSVQAALAGRTVLVYVDQLEELLTMCSDVQQQAAFSDLLADLAEAGALRLLATLRVDHYERLAHSAACHRLYALLTRDGSVKTLPPMSLSQIRDVILKPAERVGLRFLPASIVETLASETASAPSGLPLLQFALQRLWDERPREGDRPDGPRLDMITAETFARLPTVSTALGAVADRYFAEMQAQGLVDACRRLMLELTVIDERLEVPLRRRRAEGEVLDALANAHLASREQAQALVDGLVERRLLVRNGEGDARQVEVAHEALFRYWGQFQDWINKDEVRATLRETRQISRDALRWDQAQRSPDHLNLRGEPLQRALQHLQGHWLEPLAAAYVEACDASVQSAERQRAEREQALEESQAERERAQAAARQSRRTRNQVVLGGLLATLAGITIIGLLYTSRSSIEAAKKANTISVAFVLPQVRPLEALDLAFTIDAALKSPESMATLAHAIDGTGPSELVGRRQDGVAYFTESGQATVQLITDGDRLDHALVRPFGAALTDLQPPVEVSLAGAEHEILASLDVGPASRDGGRLAVVNFVQPAPGQGKGLVMSRMRVYWIAAGSPKGRPLVDLPFPSGERATRNASSIAFAASGLRIAVAASLAPWPGQEVDDNATRILQWSVGDAELSASRAIGGDQAATALAFADAAGHSLIRGQRDGRVVCADNQLMRSVEWPPVVALHATGTTHYAALHLDNSITLGDCLTHTPARVQLPGPAQPRQLSLRSSDSEGWVELSYTLQDKLVCQRFMGLDLQESPCPGHGQIADSAVPALDQGRLHGYRVLDSEEPLMTFLDVAPSLGGGTLPTDPGVPAAWDPTEQGKRSVASSPDGRHQIAIESRQDKKPSVLLRPGAGGRDDTELPFAQPMVAAVNDAGVAVVLGSRRAQPRHQLVAIAADGKPGKALSTFNDAGCMKLSPDGRHVLVASDRWQARRLTLDGTALTVADNGRDEMPDWPNPRLDPVTACALGDGPAGAVVLASRDGHVRLFDAKEHKWKPLSELVPFELGAKALDVSVDAGSRFVAVITTRRAGRCRNGVDGHLLRIWDLRLKRPDYPVASACIARDLQQIGPLEKKAGRWVLPVYVRHAADPTGALGRLRRFDYECLACGDGPADATARARIAQRARALGAQLLPADRVEVKYGIKL